MRVDHIDETCTRIADALRHIPADDRDTWVRVGMAIRAELGDDGYAIWDDWSATASNYEERAARDVWRSITPGPIGLGTLFHIARQHGHRSGAAPSPRPVPTRRAPRPRRDTSAYAAELWLRADCGDDAVIGHPYARRKDIESAGGAGRATVSGRVVGRDADCIIVPIRDIASDKVCGVQAISASGKKQTFGAAAGHCLLVGNTLDLTLPWFVAEGWASAYSMVFHHQAGHGVCAAAFGSGNMDTVAQRLAETHAPDRIIILREDDA